MYGTGISKEGNVLDMAVECGVVEKMGAWYACGTERLGQGREAAKEYLRTNPGLLTEIEEKVRQISGLEFDDDEVGTPVVLDDGSAQSDPAE
jgi:recombination protein RecA